MRTTLRRIVAPSRALLIVAALTAVISSGAVPAEAKMDACGDTVTPPEMYEQLDMRTRKLERVLEIVTGDLGDCAGQAAMPVPDSGDPDLARIAGGHPQSWAALAAYYFPANDLPTVVCLIEHESNGDPGARNGSSGAAGLMQVMPSWAPVYGYSYDDLFRPEVSLWVGRQIKDEHGWSSWSPYRRGECQ
jgi:hypothetical protein